MKKVITESVLSFEVYCQQLLMEETVGSRNTQLFKVLLVWYILFSIWMALAPADRQFWGLANIVPTLFIAVLAATHRSCPLSSGSYLLITLFLTLHAIGVHYTYSKVPFGLWLDQAMNLNRNHFDRIVHFSFGFLLAYPAEELFRLVACVRGWLLYYLPVITILGLSGLWEIIESWVARIARPDLGLTFLGSQGDMWDAQKDMAAALYGALLCISLVAGIRKLRASRPALETSQ
jgi:putative membrane protein